MSDKTENIEIIEPESSEDQEKCVLHVENYDGPLDVLWNLIKKSKIDITEISISHITEQYIAFLKLMEKLNVKLASEFIWMASELLFYKSRALLPSERLEDEYFTPPLPPELVAKLLEYKKYQQGSSELRELFDHQADSLIRENNYEELGEAEDYIEVSLFDLLRAFAVVLESQQDIEQEEIIFDEILISDRIQYITELLKDTDAVEFIKIFSTKPSRSEVIATFLAILEMSKTKIIKLYQHKTFGDIRISRAFSLDNLS